MSTVNGGQGNIVTNGLVLNLDAANPRSYAPPYNGTVWRDLSGNGRNGTLTNGPTYSSTNGGSIVFDGVDDYADFGNILNFGTSDFTIDCWVKKSSIGNTYPKVISKGSYQAGGWLIMTRNNNIFFSWGNPEKGANVNLGFNLTNVWIYGTVVRNSNVVTVYGNSISGTPSSITDDISSNYNFRIGNNGTLNEPWGGNVSQIKVYNRALSASEVLQNFNATRARFGI